MWEGGPIHKTKLEAKLSCRKTEMFDIPVWEVDNQEKSDSEAKRPCNIENRLREIDFSEECLEKKLNS